MTWFDQGGVLMWPLLALSVATLAVMFDRAVAFTTFRLADAETEHALLAARGGDGAAARARVAAQAPELLPLAEALLADGTILERERTAAIAVEETVRRLDSRLGLLAISGRVAPLIGLLGTVFGMIQTFSRLADSEGALDMTMLAGGIWQALLTTAAGLVIAIPAVAAHQSFLRREEAIAFALSRLANRVLGARPAEAAE